MTFDPSDPLGSPFRTAVSQIISSFLDGQQAKIDSIGRELRPLLDQAREATSGGKRFRPAFCYWGFAAVAGQPADPQPIVTAAASLDLLHVSALVHDDVMDESDTRRGLPAAHVAFGRQHSSAGWRGDSPRFGRAGAILLGDLLLVWSEEMWGSAGFDAAAQQWATPVLNALRTEVIGGQFLDMVAASSVTDPSTSLDRAQRVNEFKSARYTVSRPLQLGAALAGADADLLAILGKYGAPLGRAFQLRDDLLGIYGDEQRTGKPAGDDIREGKRTVLVSYALATASQPAVDRLEALLGDPQLDQVGLDEARNIIEATGARHRAEQDIISDAESAIAALKGAAIDEQARAALTTLADLAVIRDS